MNMEEEEMTEEQIVETIYDMGNVIWKKMGNDKPI